ncbi:hypothetical protein NKW45_12355 [Acetobacter orientalis]|nr:hypothetical protein [Acetobacter orientalis]MCP1222635.1 hypothetical protein [Acetobacter orientalis]
MVIRLGVWRENPNHIFKVYLEEYILFTDQNRHLNSKDVKNNFSKTIL